MVVLQRLSVAERSRNSQGIPRCSLCDTHFATTGRAVDTGQNHLVRGIPPSSGSFSALSNCWVKSERSDPVQLSTLLRDLPPGRGCFHLRSKVVVH